MTGAPTAEEYLTEVAMHCRRAAVVIRRHLARLRRQVLLAEAHLSDVSPVQFDALVAGFDIYSRMLDDALADICSVEMVDGGDTEATVSVPADPPRLTRVDRATVGAEINGIAALIVTELVGLKRLLEPLHDGSPAHGQLGPIDEWSIAAEGLVGQRGVLGFIARRMTGTWANYDNAGWSDLTTHR